MASAGTVTIDFAAETARFTAELKKVRAEVATLKSRMDGAAASFNSFRSTLNQFAGAFAIAAGFRAIVKATAESERAVSLLNSALSNAGANVEGVSKDFQDYASSLQSVTTFNDEAIIGVETLLLGFQGLSGGTIKQATRDILDLSARLGIDLESAAKTVGKALEDPVAGMTALRKAGVQFTQEQKDLIKSLVETGDKAGAQQVILRELESRYAGAAEAARNNFGGALTALGNAVDDLLEAKGGLPEATAQLNEFTTLLQSPEAKEAADSLLSGLVSALGFVAKGYLEIGKLMAQNRKEAKDDGINAAFGLDTLHADTLRLNREIAQTHEQMQALRADGETNTETYRRLSAQFIALQAELRETQELSKQLSAQRAGFEGVASKEEVAEIANLGQQVDDLRQKRDAILSSAGAGGSAIGRGILGPGAEIEVKNIDAAVAALEARIERLRFNASLTAAADSIIDQIQPVPAAPKDFITGGEDGDGSAEAAYAERQARLQAEMEERQRVYAADAQMRMDLEKQVSDSYQESAEENARLAQEAVQINGELAWERLALETAVEESIRQQRQMTAGYAVGLFQALGAKHKAFAALAIAIEKAQAIQRILVQNQVAAELAFASQLIPGDPTSLPRAIAAKAAVLAQGKLSAALVAATGVVQLANTFSNGGNALGTPGNPIFTDRGTGDEDPQYGATAQKVLHIEIHGFIGQEHTDQIIDAVREQVDGSDRIIFSGNSRQAQELREG